MKRTKILDFNSFAFMQEGENVNMIYTHPLEFFCPSISNASLTVKHQLVKVKYAPNTVDLDNLENVTIPADDDTSVTEPTTPSPEEGEEKNEVETQADAIPEYTFTYIINQDNRLVFLVPKEMVMNDCMAKEFIVGLIVSYETNKVVYTTPGTTATYNMLVKRGNDGRIVTGYQQSSLQSLLTLLPGLDNTLDVNATGGYVYEISRDLTTCKK